MLHLRADNPLYNQLIRNTLSYPAMNLDRLPLIVQNFLSSSTAPRERRMWLEKLLSEFVSSSADFEILISQGLFDKITMFSLSAMSDREETVRSRNIELILLFSFRLGSPLNAIFHSPGEHHAHGAVMAEERKAL